MNPDEEERLSMCLKKLDLVKYEEIKKCTMKIYEAAKKHEVKGTISELLAGSIYIACIIRGDRRTQSEIAEAFEKKWFKQKWYSRIAEGVDIDIKYMDYDLDEIQPERRE